jgi:hypothetical protein
MALIITEDLYYLAGQTGNDSHRNRADDTVAWAMQCMELYPEISVCGRYGVLNERFCPSDGLTIETFTDGSPSSLWFSYNGWAAANVMEALLWMVEAKRSIWSFRLQSIRQLKQADYLADVWAPRLE